MLFLVSIFCFVGLLDFCLKGERNDQGDGGGGNNVPDRAIAFQEKKIMK